MWSASISSRPNTRLCSVDEKTSIQALERTQPPLPLRTGRAVRHTHDYRRHGVLDLYAALEVATGRVTHQFSPTHTAADFLRFMKKVVRAYPDRDLHVVLDNSSTHNTEAVRDLARRPPPRAVPLHADECVVAEPDRRVLRDPDEAVPVGHGLLVEARAQDHLQAYLRAWNKNPTPFEWTKPARAIIKSHKRMLDRISTAVH